MPVGTVPMPGWNVNIQNGSTAWPLVLLADFSRTSTNYFTLNTALPWVLGNTPAVQCPFRACSERGRLLAFFWRIAHPSNNFTLDTGVPWHLSNTPSEVDRMNGCWEGKKIELHTHTHTHTHTQRETPSILVVWSWKIRKFVRCPLVKSKLRLPSLPFLFLCTDSLQLSGQSEWFLYQTDSNMLNQPGKSSDKGLTASAKGEGRATDAQRGPGVSGP